ncbi:menaquinone biosynthesis protein [soil metagenome]
MEKRKIRVGAVSYLNTKPLVWGFEHGVMQEEIELITDYPAKIAEALINDTIDVGLIPVAVIPQIPEHYIVSDYCIAAENEVASVCLFSEVPLDKIETILLDYQSRTSVQLLRVLVKHFWKLNVNFEQADRNFIDRINGKTAGLVIGDRALIQREKSKYIYDLAEAWLQMTGYPFVFAAWVSNKKLPDNFIKEFNSANSLGLNRIDDVVEENYIVEYDLKKYFTENINYLLDERKLEGLKLFLNYLSEK